ncbi:TonB-dependent siderophore receptor [Hyella patelloides]|uniref:TonB-dependent siderophore receptor n=1 Tax=Hyella patelloides TaxID=1982969 RepID=UPI001C93D0AD|nr:TonB-dependent siderophore receptor [Hyella patelloides]
MAHNTCLNVLGGAIALLMAQSTLASEAMRLPTVKVSTEHFYATSASYLLAQQNSAIVRVTAVELNQTDNKLEVILKTSAGSERLVPLILPEGKELVIDILDATLESSLKDGIEELNPAPQIRKITVNQTTRDSIQIRITGAAQTPSVEIVTGTDDLVLSISPQGTTTATEPDEEIEIIATGEREDDDYFVPDATTGTRTNTPARDVPQSIQVVPQQVLEDQQITNLEEALRNVSGVVGGTTEGTSFRFAIRGFERATILSDGFTLSASDNLARSGFQNLSEIANLEQIEVLKGPASILYGEVNPGGVINLVTKKPLAEPFYEAELELGNRNFVKPRIDISGSLTSDGSLLYRLNALYQNDDGFRDFDQNNERFFIAPALTWNIGKRTQVGFQLEYLDDQRPYNSGLIAFGEGVIDVDRGRIFNEPDDFNHTETLTTGYTLSHSFNENWQIRNQFQYGRQNRDGLTATPINFDETTGNLLRADSSVDDFKENYALQTNMVGEFTTGAIEHKLLFGVDFSNTYADLLTEVNFTDLLPLNVFDPVYGAFPRDASQRVTARDEQIETTRFGIYLQDQISLTDNFKLLGGLRYDNIDQTLDISGLAFGESEQSQNPDALTPRIGLVYQPVPPISLYTSYAQSFTPGTETTAEGDLLEPEEGEGFEVGIKADIIPNQLAVTVAYFNITKQNVASPDPDFQGVTNVFVATGEQNSQGIEFDLSGEILPGWNAIASYAYIDAEVTEDNLIPVGNNLVGIPEHSFNLWTNYTIQQGSLEGLGFGIGLNFVGEREGDINNSFKLDEYFLTNAAISYQRDSWKLAVNFKNIFDVDYVRGTPFSRLRNIEVGEPFTVIGSVSVQF